MILAGDIGGTHAHLSYYREQDDNVHFTAVHESVFKSREFRWLDEFVLKFVSDTGVCPLCSLPATKRSRGRRTTNSFGPPRNIPHTTS